MAIGRKTGGGSRKGVPNKATAELKEIILGALSDAGGREYLTRQAIQNPSAFLALIGKVLPTTLSGDPNNPVTTLSRIEVKLVNAPNRDT